MISEYKIIFYQIDDLMALTQTTNEVDVSDKENFRALVIAAAEILQKQKKPNTITIHRLVLSPDFPTVYHRSSLREAEVMGLCFIVGVSKDFEISVWHHTKNIKS